MSVELKAIDREAAEALLRRHHVGRMAFAHHDRVTIHLVNYVFADGWIYARMRTDDDVVTLRHNQWVAFEVDEVDGIYDWRSVTARGSVHFLPDPSATPVAPPTRRAYREGVRLLRSVVPAVLTPDDPIPERTNVHRIHVDELTGLAARSDGSAALPSA
jgi:nitroimidazol reductase NimA-like FMN-containing flavoprotein (pyridoxamine 5'-phosphate oxidase superfamily)